MNDFKKFSNVIKYHRKKAGLSQKALADIAGIGKTVVFDIEKGKKTVQLDSIIKIFAVLNIKIVLQSPLMNNYNTENENS